MEMRGVMPRPLALFSAVDDDEVDPLAFTQAWKQFDDGAASRLADDVTQEQDVKAGHGPGNLNAKRQNPNGLSPPALHPALETSIPWVLRNPFSGQTWSAVLAAALLLLAAAGIDAQNLSALATPPDWRRLDVYQDTLTRAEFLRLLTALYAPHGGWEPFIRVDADAAVIRTSNIPLNDLYALRFARPGAVPPPPAYWLPRDRLTPAVPPPDAPLAGVRIGARIPGHLGGRWAQLEERWFQIGDAPPVMEGEMTLRVARLVAARLRAPRRGQGGPHTRQRRAYNPPAPWRPRRDRPSGARRERPRSSTGYLPWPRRPATHLFRCLDERHAFHPRGHPGPGPSGQRHAPARPRPVACTSTPRPGAIPARPTLVEITTISMCSSTAATSRTRSPRTTCVSRCCSSCSNGSAAEEIAIAEQIAPALAAATGLPPYKYTGPNAIRVGDSPYIWARNLLANRITNAPSCTSSPTS